jgi:hypothetical protein
MEAEFVAVKDADGRAEAEFMPVSATSPRMEPSPLKRNPGEKRDGFCVKCAS